jgi:hypothetical protein
MKDCFENLFLHHNEPVSGIAGGLRSAGTGTFCFKIEDEQGNLHTIKLYGSAYVPGLPMTFLCPQHWSQHKEGKTSKDGIYMRASGRGCWLVWNKGRSRKPVPYNPATNTPSFNSAPGSFNYCAFEATYLAMDASHLRNQTVSFNNLQNSHQPPLDPAEFIPNEDFNLTVKEDLQASERVSAFDETEHTSNLSHLDLDPLALCPLHPTGHHKWGECSHNPVNVQHQKRGILTFSPTPTRDDAEADNDYISAMDDQADLLQWHCCLGHVSFNRLKQLPLIGETPKMLATVQQPKCAGCLFGKMTKVPWRIKGKANNTVHKATYPGKCVSVDQLQSTQAEFVAQLKGRLTTQRFNSATVFVDHYSRLQYIHLMTGMTSKQTTEAKIAFD